MVPPEGKLRHGQNTSRIITDYGSERQEKRTFAELLYAGEDRAVTPDAHSLASRAAGIAVPLFFKTGLSGDYL
jgi:hypothetical protein